MKAIFAVSALFAATSAQHMIYEPHPEGHQIREPGAYGQDCTPQSGDYPDKCPKVGMLKESTHGKIECIHNFDCCLCGEMICGPDCTDIICNGDSGCFGVKNIKMIGDKTYGASLNCNGTVYKPFSVFPLCILSSLFSTGSKSLRKPSVSTNLRHTYKP